MDNQILLAVTAIVGLGLVTLAALHGWQGWLALKQRELDCAPMRRNNTAREYEGRSAHGVAGTGMSRIEIADLKERIRKLEAIASGVDL